MAGLAVFPENDVHSVSHYATGVTLVAIPWLSTTLRCLSGVTLVRPSGLTVQLRFSSTSPEPLSPFPSSGVFRLLSLSFHFLSSIRSFRLRCCSPRSFSLHSRLRSFDPSSFEVSPPSLALKFPSPFAMQFRYFFRSFPRDFIPAFFSAEPRLLFTFRSFASILLFLGASSPFIVLEFISFCLPSELCLLFRRLRRLRWPAPPRFRTTNSLSCLGRPSKKGDSNLTRYC